MLNTILIKHNNPRGSILPLAIVAMAVLSLTTLMIQDQSKINKVQTAQQKTMNFKQAEANKIRSALQDRNVCSQVVASGGLKGATVTTATAAPVTQILKGAAVIVKVGSPTTYGNNLLTPTGISLRYNHDASTNTNNKKFELAVVYNVSYFNVDSGTATAQTSLATSGQNKVEIRIPMYLRLASNVVQECYSLQDSNDTSTVIASSITNSCKDVSTKTNTYQSSHILLDSDNTPYTCSTRLNASTGTTCAGTATAITGLTYSGGITNSAALQFNCGSWKPQTCGAASVASYTDSGRQLAYTVDSSGNLLCRDPITSSALNGCGHGQVGSLSGSTFSCVTMGCNVLAGPPYEIWESPGNCKVTNYSGSCGANQYLTQVNTQTCADLPIINKYCGGYDLVTGVDRVSNLVTCSSGLNYAKTGAGSTDNIYVKGPNGNNAFATSGPAY